MICEDPYIHGGVAYPCRKCDPCRAHHRRTWAHRILLEAHQYADNCFASLSYNDEHLPTFNATPWGGPEVLSTLAPTDTQLWLKRLRKAYAPRKFRFFLAGEYGDESWRPHYHLAIFNFPTCARGRTLRRPGSNRPIWDKCCAACQLVGNTWGKGDVDLGILETASALYLCGYVTKKMTRRDHPKLLGRYPEFSRQSNQNGGLGKSALWEVASQLMHFNLDNTQGDVPVALRHGSRKLPLGRYLRRELRAMIGKEKNAPEYTMAKIQEEMRPLREAAFNASEPLKTHVQAALKGKVASFNARSRIRKGSRPT